MLVTTSLTDCRLGNLIDVVTVIDVDDEKQFTPYRLEYSFLKLLRAFCEDANSKIVDVVTVADVDDEDLVGNSLLHIWELRLGNRAKIWFRL